MNNDPVVNADQPQWHSYRCPVCGHTDEVEGVGPALSALVCSHCGTELEVAAPAADAAAAVVKVATRWRRGR